MIPIPLTDTQFKFFKDLAGFAKERDLLSGRERKILFQAGQYKQWYPNRIESVSEILLEINDYLDDPTKRGKLEEILAVIQEIDVELAELKQKRVNGEETPSEKFRLGEIFYDKGDSKEAIAIFKELKDDGFDSEDIDFYLRQLNAI